MVCAYLTDRADQGLSVGTLDLACLAIAYQHRRHGLENPILNDGVRQVRLGLRRIVGTAPRRRARPLGVAEIRRILGAIDRETAKGARDAAIILLGFASALRRSELAALTVADVESEPGGLLLAVRRYKSDQDGTGQIVGVAHGQHAVTDPVAALATWSDFRGTAPGPLFTSMRHQSVTLEPLSGDAIARMLRARARAAGLAADRITAHSLRAGHATTAAVAGVSLDRIHRADPTPATVHPRRALHPPSTGTAVDLQPRPRPVTGTRRADGHEVRRIGQPLAVGQPASVRPACSRVDLRMFAEGRVSENSGARLNSGARSQSPARPPRSARSVPVR
jgi:site-specific recombinase XerD